MTVAESIFIFATIAALLIGAILAKKINWRALGFNPTSIFQGWWQLLLFNGVLFLLIQAAIASNLVHFPDWIVDRDPLLPLLIIGFLQEIVFRGLIIHWLERWGGKRALWGSTAIFVLFHLITPYAWSGVGVLFASLTLIAGYFWGRHFLKHRNIYLLGLSHFFLNLSFNYVIFSTIVLK
jgi:hypothetical protein